MKKIFYLSIVAMFLIVSCNDTTTTEETSKDGETTILTETEETRVTVETNKNGSDVLIDEYEALCSEYLETMKKMNSGDLSAADEFHALSERMSEFAEKLTENFENFTQEQMNRYTEIASKFAEESSNISK